MRFLAIPLLLLLVAGCASHEEAAPPLPLKIDPEYQTTIRWELWSNPLVQKAIEIHEHGVIDTIAYYGNAIAAAGPHPEGNVEALMVEREQKLYALKTDCLEALRRAESVSIEMNRTTEAGHIAFLINRISASPDNQRFTTLAYFTISSPAANLPQH